MKVPLEWLGEWSEWKGTPEELAEKTNPERDRGGGYSLNRLPGEGYCFGKDSREKASSQCGSAQRVCCG